MTGPKLAVPPGRAGRLWLEQRLQVARRGADLLDRKLRILQSELAERQDAAELTRQEWEQCCADAERLLLRAALLDGQRAIRLAADPGTADVRVSYTVTMGVRHPSSATRAIPEPPMWTGFALAEARNAHRAALGAAVAHAVASAALRVIEAETAVTRYRLRAVRDRWVPHLEQARAELIFALDELERADNARLSRAASLASSRPRP